MKHVRNVKAEEPAEDVAATVAGAEVAGAAVTAAEVVVAGVADAAEVDTVVAAEAAAIASSHQ